MNLLENSLNRLSRLVPHPRLIIWAAQVAIFAISGLAAFVLRFEFQVPRSQVGTMLWSVAVWVVVKSFIFYLFRLDRGWWRYVSAADLHRIGIANFAASILAAAFLFALRVPVPRSVFLLDLILCTQGTAGIRLLLRLMKELARRDRTPTGEITLIYGAGEAGVSLLREIHSNPRLNYNVRGFVDENPRKKGMLIHRVPVLGSGANLTSIAAGTRATELLIAIPSATGPQMARMIQAGQAAGLRCRTIPGMHEILEGRHLSSQIRDVAVEDLLGRSQIELEQDAISHKICGKTILVSGAAGSIGSELCRQLARFAPAAIVGYEIAETPLFHLENELRQSFPDVLFIPEIGSIQNPQRIAEVLDQHRPSAIFHAAAYKHVPMMELHPFEAVENNLVGTWNLAFAAKRYGVGDFVMISSDKAVRPTNIMGATKRLAELLIHGMQNGGTKFVSVRFGNVLGSNGSVVPIFKSQIAAGGPLTITHPEMRRYFMTIPEACQLVLQASTMGRGGEIFVLDMGQPVKIVDLATNLILLSGLRPGHDIKINFTGLRPGEKLYEELSTYDESTLPTHHEKIKIFAANGLPNGSMETHLRTLRDICRDRATHSLILELKDLVPDYNPSSQLLRAALNHRPIPITNASSYPRPSASICG